MSYMTVLLEDFAPKFLNGINDAMKQAIRQFYDENDRLPAFVWYRHDMDFDSWRFAISAGAGDVTPGWKFGEGEVWDLSRNDPEDIKKLLGVS